MIKAKWENRENIEALVYMLRKRAILMAERPADSRTE